jgi:hypothetical protein
MRKATSGLMAKEQADIAATRLGLRRLETEAVRLDLCQRFADLSNLTVEIETIPAECPATLPAWRQGPAPLAGSTSRCGQS